VEYDAAAVQRLCAPEDAAKPKGKSGRPSKDWETIDNQIITIVANSPDGLPTKQADLVRLIEQWCSLYMEDAPENSAIRARVSKIYEHYQQHGKQRQKP
jgi:hypothetical protein